MKKGITKIQDEIEKGNFFNSEVREQVKKETSNILRKFNLKRTEAFQHLPKLSEIKKDLNYHSSVNIYELKIYGVTLGWAIPMENDGLKAKDFKIKFALSFSMVPAGEHNHPDRRFDELFEKKIYQFNYSTDGKGSKIFGWSEIENENDITNLIEDEDNFMTTQELVEYWFDDLFLEEANKKRKRFEPIL